MAEQQKFGKDKARVVVAMSGGVDSSVAAALLVEQGYEVVGMMMRLWSEPGNGTATAVNRCCTPDQMADARRVARMLDIPFYVLDVQEKFRNIVVQFFIDEYRAGRTPNPCIECNRTIRFTHLLNHALALDAHYLATGHYARIRPTQDGFQLLQAVDDAKDQSYVLHVLGQQQLARTLFPIGAFTKAEVRQLAGRFGLPVASKQESQDLCFLADGDYHRFLREHDGVIHLPGPILDVEGRVLGQHTGLPNYTVGQRKGLGISAPEPLFVMSKDVQRNALVVATRDHVSGKQLIARDVNWVSGKTPSETLRVHARVRYRAHSVPAEVTAVEPDGALVIFDEPVFGIAPGQGVVFYDGEICLGGGIIRESRTTRRQIEVQEPHQAT